MNENTVSLSTEAAPVPVANDRPFMDMRPRGEAPVSLLPDPEPHHRWYAIVSVDDHLLEPDTLFRGRVAATYADVVPQVIDQDDGAQAWVVDSVVRPISMFNAITGRPLEE